MFNCFLKANDPDNKCSRMATTVTPLDIALQNWRLRDELPSEKDQAVVIAQITAIVERCNKGDYPDWDARPSNWLFAALTAEDASKLELAVTL
jgi:hypothetical protein